MLTNPNAWIPVMCNLAQSLCHALLQEHCKTGSGLTAYLSNPYWQCLHATIYCLCTFCRLKSWWDAYSGNFSIIVGDTRHGPSKIPTAVDLPHKTFGSQLVDDSQYERPDILPFSTYAACRILDTNPEDMVSNLMLQVGSSLSACSSHL